MGACGALRCHGCKQPLPGAGLIIRVGSRGRDPRLSGPGRRLDCPSSFARYRLDRIRRAFRPCRASRRAGRRHQRRAQGADHGRRARLAGRAVRAVAPFAAGGLRAWVEAQTHHPLGYVEQLYTFADGDRSDESGARVMSVSYLGLTREAGETGVAQVGWQDWYRYFPWEDRRAGVPALLDETIAPRLAAWCEAGADQASRARRQRADITFGERRGLERGHGAAALRAAVRGGPGARGRAARAVGGEALPGEPMRHDHRRILATGIARLRAKIKYRPVVFELMPASSPCCNCSRPWRRWRGAGCTSRISGG